MPADEHRTSAMRPREPMGAWARIGPWRTRTILLAGVAAAAILLVRLVLFTVEAGEHAIVTAFGNPVQVITSSGLHAKYPHHSVTRFDHRLVVFAPAQTEFLTRDKTAVMAASAILWRVAEPRRFFETVRNRQGAEARLNDIVFAELGAALGREPLSAFVATDSGAYRAEDVLAEVAAGVREAARRDYGIEVVDVQLRRFDFPERNRLRVYARMKSERGRISMKYRSEGEEEGLMIRAAAEEEKARILAEAYMVAERLRGEGEAEAARIYAEALEGAPDFYRFLRTLEASRVIVRDGTTLVLPADSELFGLLVDSGHFEHVRPPASAAGTPDGAAGPRTPDDRQAR
jgi:modulator of FtsH protease HflC